MEVKLIVQAGTNHMVQGRSEIQDKYITLIRKQKDSHSKVEARSVDISRMLGICRRHEYV